MDKEIEDFKKELEENDKKVQQELKENDRAKMSEEFVAFIKKNNCKMKDVKDEE